MRTRRRLRLASAAGLVALVLAAGAVTRFYAYPATDGPRRVDAVVVLAGSENRLPTAEALVRRGVAPVLVMDPDRPSWARLCGQTEPFPVVCYTLEDDSTRGEARAFTRLAARRGWDSIALVTSTYHLTRARMLFERCFPGRVLGVSAGMQSSAIGVPFHVARDVAATVAALTFARGC